MDNCRREAGGCSLPKTHKDADQNVESSLGRAKVKDAK